MKLPIVISAIVYRKINNDYEFLLLKRVPEKGGFWQPPAGSLEDTDKTKLEGLYRELFEETSLRKEDVIRTIEDVHYFEFSDHYLTGEPIDTIKEYVYALEVHPDVKIILGNNHCNEHETFKWCSFDESMRLMKWDNNKEGYEKLRKILGF